MRPTRRELYLHLEQVLNEMAKLLLVMNTEPALRRIWYAHQRMKRIERAIARTEARVKRHSPCSPISP
jgi:hypothetical protein